MIHLVFTRLPGKMDRLQITRADGSTAEVDCPRQGMIPHDMVHHAVESVLHAPGFLRRVAAGEGLGFTEGASLEAEPVERLVDVMQADVWSSGGTGNIAEMRALYQLACEERGHPAAPVEAADILQIRAVMADLATRWNAVPLHGNLTLSLA
ncbi:hypothetical protein [Sandaracinobacteroides hominis]|uniref:hypothetical protein n=1 Tax=Sandaracinobacteroides hominis TaxID=2780086 RepID=UPI0018F5E9A3|nr:hypothetical protein [Sandaracinobacteroides hominis]